MFEPDRLILPAVVPTRVHKDRPAVRTSADHLAFVERALSEEAAFEKTGASQVVESKSAPFESTLDELTASPRLTAKRAILEACLREEHIIE